MNLTNLDDLRTALKLAGLKPQKGLGQHFLVDQSSLEAVMDAAKLTAADTVLEIGPGLGVMTWPLAERVGRVIAVEADEQLAGLLRRQAPANLEVISGDILDFDLRRLPPGYKVAANLPYYITAKILRLLIEGPNPPAVMSLLVQREVAERITAGPGDYSVLALSVQYYGRPRLVQIVERHKFWPAPAVDSAILQIQLTGPAFAADPAKLFRLIKAGFGERRKQLVNSLAGGLNASADTTARLLATAKIAPTARAQELSLADWQKLYAVATKANLLP